MIENALIAGFHRIIHRARPVPVGPVIGSRGRGISMRGVEIREVGIVGRTDRAAVEDPEDLCGVGGGKRPSGDCEVERLAASTDAVDGRVEWELLHSTLIPSGLRSPRMICAFCSGPRRDASADGISSRV